MNRRRLALLLAVVLGSLVAATAAWAGFPHFLSFSAPTLVSGTSGTATTSLALTATAAPHSDPRVLIERVVVGGVDAGGHVETTLTAPFEAVYVCTREDGSVPDTPHTTTLTGEVVARGVFRANRHGRATGSLLTGPLPTGAEAAAATGFACPSGQALELDQARFSELVLAAHGGETVPIHGTLVSD